VTTISEAEATANVVRGRRLVLITAVLWSLGGVIAKGLAPFDGIAIAFYRSLFAGLALLPFIPRSRWVLKPSMLPVMVVFGAMVGLYISALTRTTAANAILLQCTATFWTVPIGYLVLRERPGRRALMGIGLATVGIAILVAFGRKGTPGEGLGIAMGLGSGVGYAVAIVAMRAFRDLDSAWLSAANNLGGSLCLGAFALIVGGSIAVPTVGQGLILLGFGVVQMAIPYALFARGLRTIGAAEAGLISLIEPVLNPVWVYLGHGERPEPATLLGGAILLSGVAVRYWPTR
jgi:drug/metabolite transporter (DMT)-like permease